MKKKTDGDTERKGLPEEEKARNLLKGIKVPPFVFDLIRVLENPVLGPEEKELGSSLPTSERGGSRLSERTSRRGSSDSGAETRS